MNKFIIIASAVLIFGYGYLGFSLITPLGLEWLPTLVAWLIFAIPVATIFWLPLYYWRREHVTGTMAETTILRTAYLNMAFLSFVLMGVVIRDLLALVERLAPRLAIPGLYSPNATAIILGFALISLGFGFFFARNPHTKKVSIHIDLLPKDLEGFKIVQLSDVHIGNMIGKTFVENVVAQVNALGADLIAITGDLVDGMPEQLEPHFTPLKTLSAKYGKFYVTGNHEYYWDARGWIEAVRSIGVTPLSNAFELINVGGAKVLVVGVPDAWASQLEHGTRSDPKAAIANAPNANVNILLAHQPKTALQAHGLGYHLMLSGHTHGGQFLPWTFVVKLFQPFVRGLYRYKNMWVYVNMGTGFWGPPIRLGSRSEITLLTLTATPEKL